MWVSSIMLSEQTLLNAAVLTVDATAHNGVLAGIVFNVLLIARAPLQLFQAIQTSLLPHLTGLEATDGHEAFARAIRVTILAIAGFAPAVALGLLAIGPFALEHVFFGQVFNYNRFGLALIGVGMGLHLTSGALNQAALARDRARAAAVCWVCAAVVFLVWMLSSPVSEQLLRAEIGYAGATALLALMLAPLYRRGSRAGERGSIQSEAGRRRRPTRRSPGRPRRGLRGEDRRARDEHVRAGLEARGRGQRLDAAVHLDRHAGADERAHARKLVERVRDERLPAPARVHGHAQRDVDRPATSASAPTAVAGLIARPTHAPALANQVGRVGHVRGRLGVEGDRVGARLDELARPGARDARSSDARRASPPASWTVLCERRDDQRAERDRRHEMAVHHVHVDHPRARLQHF